jgi:hypothetical protein
MTTRTQQQLTAMLANVLAKHVEPIFKAGTRFTIIARTPGNNEADVLVSDDDLDEIVALVEALAASPVPGPWTWWTSCSFRRLSSDATGKDGDVLSGTWQRSDGHPDIVATQPTMDYIAAANPERIQRVLGELKQLREQAARYAWLCSHLTQIHVETTQPAGSPADSPMRVTLIQAWPNLPRTEPGSVDEAVRVAMQEGL